MIIHLVNNSYRLIFNHILVIFRMFQPDALNKVITNSRYPLFLIITKTIIMSRMEEVYEFMSLELVDMVDIDTSSGLVYLNLNIDLRWVDYRLAWNTTLTNGISNVYFDSSFMWIPDITLYNQASGSNILDAPVILYSNGNCWLSRD